MIILVPAAMLWAALALAGRLDRRPLPATSPIGPQRDEAWRRKIARWAVLFAIFGIFPLVGIPGAVFFDLAEPVALLWCTQRGIDRFNAGGGWPAAMLVTVAWPSVFPLAYSGIRLVRTRAQLIAATIAGVAVAIAAGVAMVLFFYIVYC